MKKPEILSPAGNMQCLVAAIEGGCDAVYLGGKMYGARAFSSNFTDEEIKDAVKLAHSYGVKVYVTLNTLVYENEVNEFIKYVEFLYINNVDAIIVQDIGMMDLIIQTFPNFEVHASTQMHIHNLEGAKLVEKLGVSRCVLARETPIELIRKIKENTNIELEIFVHGALCISYSGQCLMSSLIGNRSGNRGTCAGSCRLKYDVLNEKKEKVNKNDYNLSTKDLNTLENIGYLIDIGVDSLKIEGRMKSPAYVYLVTKLYRNAVDSYLKTKKVSIDSKLLQDLKKTFNREYTKGFIFGESNRNFINSKRPNHQGVEIGKVLKVDKNRTFVKLTDDLYINDGIRFIGKEDTGMIVTKMEINNKKVSEAHKNDVVTLFIKEKVENGSIVVKTTDYNLNKQIENLIKEKNRKVLISGNLILKKDKPILLEITDTKNKIKIEGNIVEKAINAPIKESEVFDKLNRTGDTVFKFEKINIDMDTDVFVSIKDLNEIRRQALNKLYDERTKNIRNFIKGTYKREVTEYERVNEKSVYLFTSDLYSNKKLNNFDRVYYDANQSFPKGFKKLPRVIEEYKDYKEHLLVGELGSIYRYNDVDTDFSLNVVNSYSVALLNYLNVKRITLSYELTDDQIEELISAYKRRYNKRPNLAIIVYAKEEMMVSKFNLMEYFDLRNKAYLKDRYNNLYSVYTKDKLMYIINYKPRILDYKKYFDMGIDEVRYNLVDNKDLDYI